MFTKSSKRLGLWLGIFLLAALLLSGILIFWNVRLFAFESTTDANRITAYATFISGIVSVVTLLLVYFAFVATRNQIRISEKQNFDTTYFSYIGSHRAIFDRIQKSKHKAIIAKFEDSMTKFKEIALPYNANYQHKINKFNSKVADSSIYNLGELFKEAHEFSKDIQDKDFFDIIIHYIKLEYFQELFKELVDEKDNYSVRIRIYNPIDDIESSFENYFKNLMSILQYIDNNKLLNQEEKMFYASVLKNMCSTNELRVLFYYMLKRDDTMVIEWKRLLDNYCMFDFLHTNGDNNSVLYEDDLKAYRIVGRPEPYIGLKAPTSS